jgi:hypothetical protein
LGYPPGLDASAREQKNASARQYLWCFLGARNASRADLVRACAQVPRSFVSLPNARAGDPMLSRTKYLEIMCDAAFAPAPMGNVVTETWRFWEALELGAIPVAPRRLALDYYTELLGPHPVPTFRTWAEAATFMARFENDKAGLDALQAEVSGWWRSQKSEWSRRLAEFIHQGHSGQFKQELAAFSAFSMKANQGPRMIEFLKHHDIAAIKGRASLAFSRLVGAGKPERKAHHPLDTRA